MLRGLACANGFAPSLLIGLSVVFEFCGCGNRLQVSCINLYFVTSRGAKWVEGAEPIPEDVESHTKLLQQLAPTIDSVILQYVREGLSSFERRMFFAGAVMVGAAAEKAAYPLADDLSQSLKDGSKKQKLMRAIERRKLFDLLDLLREYSQDNGIPYFLSEGGGVTLDVFVRGDTCATKRCGASNECCGIGRFGSTFLSSLSACNSKDRAYKKMASGAS